MYEIFHLVKLMAYYKYKQMNREMRVYIIINPFVERNFMERGWKFYWTVQFWVLTLNFSNLFKFDPVFRNHFFYFI